MPHFTIEHSALGRLAAEPEELVESVFDAAEQSGLFKPGDIKVRALACTATQIGPEDAAFIHVAGRIMPGRTDAQKSLLAQAIADAIKALETGAGALTVEINDINRDAYAKYIA